MKKVLIVDDDMFFIENIVSSCCENMSVSIAKSISQASTLLSNDFYDFILANSKVPGGSSLSLKDKLSEHSKILFMSSFDNDCDIFKKNGDDFCPKYDINKTFRSFVNNNV